jgi:hypothetical protein
VELEQYSDYTISSSMTIQLIGNIADLGGALQDEVFTGEISNVPANSVFVADAEIKTRTYTLGVGQSVLNLGAEYKVGVNLLEGSQIGSIKIHRDGMLLMRNVGNVVAAPAADGNYHEVDAGGGFGSTIEVNNAPTVQAAEIIVEFGLVGPSDLSLIGDIEAIQGQQLAIAEDLAIATGNPLTNYLTANPSTVERRAFGDSVLKLEGLDFKSQIKTPAGVTTANGVMMTFNNLEVGKWYFLAMQGSLVSNGGDNLQMFASNPSTILSLGYENNAGGGGDQVQNGTSRYFQAGNSVLTINAGGIVDLGTSIIQASTFAQLVELPFIMVATTQWT